MKRTPRVRIKTSDDVLQPEWNAGPMPIKIEGVTYFSATDIQRDISVARQTLWRWRKARKVPQGRRYRDQQIVFTKKEVEAIRGYANRLAPAEPTKAHQPKLSNSSSRKRSVR